MLSGIYLSVLLTRLVFVYVAMDGKIADSVEVTSQEFLYHVGLERYSINICSGVIISTRHILTAANCFSEGGQVYVRYGSYIMLKGGHMTPVVHVEKHPSYTKYDHEHDIAVVFVKQMEHRQSFRIVYLVTIVTDPFQQGWVSGWGYVNDTARPEKLQYALMNLLPQEYCEKRWNRNFPNKVICYWNGHINLCRGDSGGPLVYLDYLIGIASRGTPACGYKLPTIFINLYEYAHWVSATIVGDTPSRLSSAAAKTKLFL